MSGLEAPGTKGEEAGGTTSWGGRRWSLWRVWMVVRETRRREETERRRSQSGCWGEKRLGGCDISRSSRWPVAGDPVLCSGLGESPFRWSGCRATKVRCRRGQFNFPRPSGPGRKARAPVCLLLCGLHRALRGFGNDVNLRTPAQTRPRSKRTTDSVPPSGFVLSSRTVDSNHRPRQKSTKKN